MAKTDGVAAAPRIGTSVGPLIAVAGVGFGLLIGTTGWVLPHRVTFLVGVAVFAVGVGAVAGMVLRRSSRAWAALLIAVLVAVLVGAAGMATPAYLTSRMSSTPLWQTSSGSPVLGVVTAGDRVYVLDEYAIRAFETATGRLFFSVDSDGATDIAVGADGSFVSYRKDPDSDSGHARYYGPRGRERWTVTVTHTPPNPTMAIDRGLVVLFDRDHDQEIYRGIGPNGQEIWRRPEPDYPGLAAPSGTALSVAATDGQPGDWFTEGARRAPRVAAIGTDRDSPVLVLDPTGRVIDRTKGKLLGIRGDLVIIGTADCRVEARRNGRRLWRTGPLPCGREQETLTTNKRLYLQPDDELPASYGIALADGAVRELGDVNAAAGSQSIDVDGRTLIRTKPDDGVITAVDAASGERLWSAAPFADGKPDDEDGYATMGNGAVTVVAPLSGVGRRLSVIGGKPATERIVIMDARTGERTGRMITRRGQSEFGPLPVISTSYGLGAGHAMIIMVTGQLLVLGR